ncbi:MAG TPA: PPK2 family polyphosphate kinase [Blastocatellia bacterium]|nr:PPK2 family polyphosphate kinase [Blastocatellia bacterium]
MSLSITVKPGDKVRLADVTTGSDPGLTKEQAAGQLKEDCEHLGELQELLYAANRHALLIILQGMDTSGKDGTIKHVMSEVNPQGCRVESFKVPTEQELAHDFLWRAHKVTPPRGMMTIFNRSHYEDVVVVRVHDLVPESVWGRRYDHINDFEKSLTDSSTIVLKFYLHISREEQKKRLQAREEDPNKAWKLSAGDWRERKYWDDYMRAYDDAITRTTTEHAPWHIIPADKKWFRNLAVAAGIRKALDPYRGEWEQHLSEVARRKIAELRDMRAAD